MSRTKTALLWKPVMGVTVETNYFHATQKKCWQSNKNSDGQHEAVIREKCGFHCKQGQPAKNGRRGIFPGGGK